MVALVTEVTERLGFGDLVGRLMSPPHPGSRSIAFADRIRFEIVIGRQH
jgi:hypothetical protein